MNRQIKRTRKVSKNKLKTERQIDRDLSGKAEKLLYKKKERLRNRGLAGHGLLLNNISFFQNLSKHQNKEEKSWGNPFHKITKKKKKNEKIFLLFCWLIFWPIFRVVNMANRSFGKMGLDTIFFFGRKFLFAFASHNLN